MAGESAEFLAAREVLYLERVVRGGGDPLLPIRRQRHAGDRQKAAVKRAQHRRAWGVERGRERASTDRESLVLKRQLSNRSKNRIRIAGFVYESSLNA